MKVSVIFFGQLTDITKTASLDVRGIKDTNSLVQQLYEQFPGLRSAKFIIAVNNERIIDNSTLTEDSTIALMPPFSGG